MRAAVKFGFLCLLPGLCARALPLTAACQSVSKPSKSSRSSKPARQTKGGKPASPFKPAEPASVCIGTFSMFDYITREHLIGLARTEKLDGLDTPGGDLGLVGVYGPRAEAKRYVEVLRADSRKRGYPILLDEMQRVEWRARGDWREEWPARPLAELLDTPAFAASTPVGKALRTAEARRATSTHPYVTAIRTLRREYLKVDFSRTDDRDGVKVTTAPDVGWEVEVDFGTAPDENAPRLMRAFQVYHGGEKVRYCGFEP